MDCKQSVSLSLVQLILIEVYYLKRLLDCNQSINLFFEAVLRQHKSTGTYTELNCSF